MSETGGKGRNLITFIFGNARGDRIEGAKVMAQNNIERDDVKAFTPEQIATAFEAYKNAHQKAEVDYTNDITEFEKSVLAQLGDAAGRSEFFKKNKS